MSPTSERINAALARGETLKVQHMRIRLHMDKESAPLQFHCTLCDATLEFPFDDITVRVVDAQTFLKSHTHKDVAS